MLRVDQIANNLKVQTNGLNVDSAPIREGRFGRYYNFILLLNEQAYCRLMECDGPKEHSP